MVEENSGKVKNRIIRLLQRVKGSGPLGLSSLSWIIILLAIAKIVAFVYLFNLEFVTLGKLNPSNWWWVFYRWDSDFYYRIASIGYVDLAHWAFFPAFPAVIRTINFLVADGRVSTVLAGLIFGVLWVPIYYKIAAFYIGEKKSVYSTLMFVFFPTVFLFTTVGYSEGFWLTLTLLGWYLYSKGKPLMSSAVLAISTLARVPGIVLPGLLFLHGLKQRKIKQALMYTLPFLALFAWFAYGFTQTGEPFAPVAAGAKTRWDPHFTFAELFMAPMLSGVIPFSWSDSSVFIILAIALFSYLCLKVFSVDKVLGFYSVSLLGLYLITAYVGSLSRFLPFIFPIWINFKVERKSLLLAYVFLNFFLALLLWAEFLSDRWVG